MRKPNMKRIVTLLRQLSPSQLKAVAVEMAALEARSGATALIEGRGTAGRSCPHCPGLPHSAGIFPDGIAVRK